MLDESNDVWGEKYLSRFYVMSSCTFLSCVSAFDVSKIIGMFLSRKPIFRVICRYLLEMKSIREYSHYFKVTNMRLIIFEQFLEFWYNLCLIALKHTIVSVMMMNQIFYRVVSSAWFDLQKLRTAGRGGHKRSASFWKEKPNDVVSKSDKWRRTHIPRHSLINCDRS